MKGMLGEDGNPDDMFIDKKNHIFINKLTYLCKNYDTAFKDVSFFPFIPKIGPKSFFIVILTETLIFVTATGLKVEQTSLRRPDGVPAESNPDGQTKLGENYTLGNEADDD